MRSLVHIVPLGWEHDRAVLPVLELKAHRVHIISRNDSEENRYFVAKAKERLLRESQGTEVHVISIDDCTREFESLVLHLSRIIVEEHARGSTVYLNIGASGKIAAAAAALVGMYHHERIHLLYYAPATDYAVLREDPRAAFRTHGLSVGSGDIYELPHFVIQRPSQPAVAALTALYNKGAMTYAELIAHLRIEGLPGFSEAELPKKRDASRSTEDQRVVNRWVAKLRRAVLDELRSLRLVEFAPRDRLEVRVRLTREGEYHALMGGTIYELRPSRI